MEEQLNEAWADNAKLREENSALLGRNSILEKVLALRDEQLQNLTRNQVRLERCARSAPALVCS